ncbi:MAG TPA: UvrD-helicase domain-containing protein, partial [Nocardioides sp.]|nr:UvrD-helicase domain-containing protein [Nocardioides sp.]
MSTSPPSPPAGSSATDQLDPEQIPAEVRTTRRGPTAEELLDGLNEPQRKAVVHAGRPLLVVAGAGSGKTRVLTRRIAWLVAERKAHPGSILAITFTNKAAAEMKERVEALVGKRARIMWVSTFHSACVRILRKEIHHFGYKSNFSIYDAADSKRLMTLVCRDLDLDPKQYQPNAILHWVSNHKNELRDHEEAAKDARNGLEEAYASAYTLYQRRLREANALDFDDLIMTTVHLFQAHPEVCETYRRRFRHVLVDEYQDTNHAQYALVHQLCGDPLEVVASDDTTGSRDSVAEGAELMVVGDADQSIYAFRGASIRNILDFEQDFPDATTILLEQNYRSTQTILNAANAVIGHNQGRKPKRLWSQAGDGARIVGYVADDERDEARFVSEEIDKLTDSGGARPGEVAVFYRTNAQSRVFEEIFIRLGMPYKVVGGVRFYERREVRDALAYLRMLVNPADEISLRRVLNTPKRGIGDRAVACVQSLADRDRITFWEALRRAGDAPGLATRSLKAIEGFVGLVDELQSMVDAGERADVILESVLDRTGYLAELEASDDPQDGTRVENLAELVAVAREFSDDPVAGPSADPTDPDDTVAGSLVPGLSDFLERVALVADTDQIPDTPDEQDDGVVTLMTLHTAKGLEFPVV